jgi:hypothetical protein
VLFEQVNDVYDVTDRAGHFRLTQFQQAVVHRSKAGLVLVALFGR